MVGLKLALEKISSASFSVVWRSCTNSLIFSSTASPKWGKGSGWASASLSAVGSSKVAPSCSHTGTSVSRRLL